MKLHSLLLLLSSSLLLACGDRAVDSHAEHAGHGQAEKQTSAAHTVADESAHDHDHADPHADPHADAAAEAAKGPHGGRLLEQSGYRVELAIHEDGVPPHYRAWLYRGAEPLAPEAGSLRVQLTRLGGRVDVHTFVPSGDFLHGQSVVEEPHSFDVQVDATVAKTVLRWSYASHEGRTRIAADIAEQSGIRVAAAGPGVIADTQEVQGILTPVEGRHTRVVARFPGPIKAVRVGVGDTVQAGQTLAVVESNISLSDYVVSAPFAGTVMLRNAGVGELAGDAALFEIADLRKLWVDLHLFGPGAQQARDGLEVEVTRMTDGATASTTLDRVLPGTATASQSTIARATLDNTDGNWRPGSAVRARITLAQTPVELQVPLAALQNFRDWDVVFIQVGEDYEIRPLSLGRRDAQRVEVLSGLMPGDAVVVEQSYLIKADIEKTGAAHDH